MPPLKREVSKEEFEQLPDVLKEHYVEGEGETFALEAEGFITESEVSGLKSALDAERKNRKKAEEERKQLSKRFGDLDPEAAREALKRQEEMQDKKLIDEGKIEELLAAKTERMLKNHEAQVTALNEKLEEKTKLSDRLSEQLAVTKIDNAIRQVALRPEVGVAPTAISDLILRARGTWILDESGNPVPVSGDGGTIIYGSDANQPMSMEEWILGLKGEAPHLFGKSAGSGSGNNGAGGTPKKRRGEMSNEEKSAFISKHGSDEFLKLPA